MSRARSKAIRKIVETLHENRAQMRYLVYL